MHPRLKERLWPTIIILALAANVILGVVLARVAAGDRHFAVEPDYYRKAVGWAAVMAQDAQSEALGWRVVPQVGSVNTATPGAFDLQIRTREGQPLRDAAVWIEAIPIAYAGQAVKRELAAADTLGLYRTVVTFPHLGLWEFRVTVVKGSDRFTTNLRLDLSATLPAVVVAARPGDALP